MRRKEGGKNSETRAAACGLGFSIKLFCGRSDNQTIVQYILFECLPLPFSISVSLSPKGHSPSPYLLQFPLMYNSK